MGGSIELVPTLTEAEIERLSRFGDVCRFADSALNGFGRRRSGGSRRGG